MGQKGCHGIMTGAFSGVQTRSGDHALRTVRNGEPDRCKAWDWGHYVEASATGVTGRSGTLNPRVRRTE